jgi:DNA primase
MLESGLGKQNDSSDSVYDTFRGRLMFPICDREGRTIGFTARVLDDSLPKYLNTPQTPLYDKSQALFGLHLAKQAIRETKEVVIVEGNMDVVASHQAGIKQVVASSGTALTIDQLRTLSKMTKTIKLAFDRDRAGLVATERAIELGQKLGLNLSVVTLKEAKDADELIARNPEEWREAIRNAPYIVDYLFEQFKLEYDLTSAMGKRQYTDRLAANLKRLADPVERDHYLKKLAEAVGVSEEAVQAKLDQAPEAASTPAELKRAPIQNIPQRRSNHDQLEESVLALALSYPVTRMSLQDLRLEDFSLTQRQAIFTALKSHVQQPGVEVVDSLTEYKDYGNILLLRGEQDFTDIPPADRSFEAFQLARRLRIATNQEIKENLSQQLHEAESSGDVVLARKLLEQYQAILTEEI